MTRKRLCIDLRWIDSSGVGVYIKGIMPGLVELLKDVEIVGLGRPERLAQFAWSSAANFRVVACRSERYSMAEQFELPRAIPRGTALFYSPYYTIPLFYRGRLAVTVHDMSHLVVPEIAGNWKKRLYAKTMYRRLRRKATAILTVSEFSKRELLRLTEGPRADNVFTTYPGVAPEWYDAGRSLRPRRAPYFICVGNIKPYKNLPRLVEAFLSVLSKVPQELVIVGQSEGLITGESPAFFERLKAGGARIQLTGHVEDEELMALVAHADALVMPSTYEGFGLPALEALAAGTPVVVSRVASLPEVCGDSALYFDPLDVGDIAAKLVQIAESSDLRSRLSASGVKQSRRFSWEACACATAHVLGDALVDGTSRS